MSKRIPSPSLSPQHSSDSILPQKQWQLLVETRAVLRRFVSDLRVLGRIGPDQIVAVIGIIGNISISPERLRKVVQVVVFPAMFIVSTRQTHQDSKAHQINMFFVLTDKLFTTFSTQLESSRWQEVSTVRPILCARGSTVL